MHRQSRPVQRQTPAQPSFSTVRRTTSPYRSQASQLPTQSRRPPVPSRAASIDRHSRRTFVRQTSKRETYTTPLDHQQFEHSEGDNHFQRETSSCGNGRGTFMKQMSKMVGRGGKVIDGTDECRRKKTKWGRLLAGNTNW